MGSNNQGQGSRRRDDDILPFPDNPTVILKGPRSYLRWSRTIEAELKKKDMQGILDLTVKVPEVNERRYDEWKATNQRVLSWIRRSVSKDIDDIVGTSWTTDPASKVWKTLKELYSPHDAFKIVKIKEEIYSVRQETQDLAQYFDKFNALWTELETMGDNKCTCKNGKKAREEEKLACFLWGLDRRFSRTGTEMMKQNPLPSFQVAVDRLLEAQKNAAGI